MTFIKLFQIVVIMKTLFDYHDLKTYCLLLRKPAAGLQTKGANEGIHTIILRGRYVQSISTLT